MKEKWRTVITDSELIRTGSVIRRAVEPSDLNRGPSVTENGLEPVIRDDLNVAHIRARWARYGQISIWDLIVYKVSWSTLAFVTCPPWTTIRLGVPPATGKSSQSAPSSLSPYNAHLPPLLLHPLLPPANQQRVRRVACPTAQAEFALMAQ